MKYPRIEEAIIGWFGPRCTEKMEGCACCAVWADYDRLKGGVKTNFRKIFGEQL